MNEEVEFKGRNPQTVSPSTSREFREIVGRVESTSDSNACKNRISFASDLGPLVIVARPSVSENEFLSWSKSVTSAKSLETLVDPVDH
jgi:hypothetical protein